MHHLLLVITDDFPSYSDIELKMFPFGEPSYNHRALSHYGDRFKVVQDFPTDFEDNLEKCYYLTIKGEDDNRSYEEEATISLEMRKKYDALVNKDFPMNAEELYTASSGKRYTVKVNKVYDLSKGLIPALANVGYVELDYKCYDWLGVDEAGLYQEMLEYGTTSAVIAVDNKLQFYTLHGFSPIWDWWVIGGRWTHHLLCDINGRANATRCNELDLESMKSGDIAYASTTIAQLFSLTMHDFDWLTRFQNLPALAYIFAIAVHEYLYIKHLVTLYNEDVDKYGYKEDLKGYKVGEMPDLSTKVHLDVWFKESVNKLGINPGELSMLDLNRTIADLPGCSLALLKYQVGHSTALHHSFLYAKDAKLDTARTIELTRTFSSYLECMSKPVFVGTPILIDDILYDPWCQGTMKTGDDENKMYVVIDHIDEKHLKYFDFEDKDGIYYAAIVELPEGRSIPWHMFIEGILGHPEMQTKYVTVVDYHS